MSHCSYRENSINVHVPVDFVFIEVAVSTLSSKMVVHAFSDNTFAGVIRNSGLNYFLGCDILFLPCGRL